MIGNDIIDLELAARQSNWLRKGFLQKLFTDQEQHFILNSENPFQTVWLFWSMKESAYKVYVQKNHCRFYAPQKFKCSLSSSTTGMVFIENERYVTASKMNVYYMFTEAALCTPKYKKNGSFIINHKPFKSDFLYKQLKQDVSKKLTIPINELHMRKNTFGVPKLFHKKKCLEVSFSLSHHGNYSAYSILNISK